MYIHIYIYIYLYTYVYTLAFFSLLGCRVELMQSIAACALHGNSQRSRYARAHDWDAKKSGKFTGESWSLTRWGEAARPKALFQRRGEQAQPRSYPHLPSGHADHQTPLRSNLERSSRADVSHFRTFVPSRTCSDGIYTIESKVKRMGTPITAATPTRNAGQRLYQGLHATGKAQQKEHRLRLDAV